MKKLFTLVALLACFLGAKAQQAQWEEVYTIDYATYSGFPFYVMGYVPEFDNGCMTDFGADYRYETQDNLDGDGDGKWKDGEESIGTVKTSTGTEYQKVTGANPYWHQYFIATAIPTVIDESYKIVALVKASEDVNINVDMRWSWSENALNNSVNIPQSEDFVEVEWEYSGIGGSSCDLIAQPGNATAIIEWQSLTVYHKMKANQRPKVWLEDIVNGDAETPWENPNVEFNDQENNYKICAWGKEREGKMNNDGGWDPVPATIEEEEGNESNHVFVVHGKQATTEGDAAAWDNQFWIQSQHEWKSGTQLKIKFRYKASKTVTVATQCHKQNPSDYLIWHAIGDINFTEDWQTFDNTMTIADDMAGTWSIAFQLNQNDKDAIDFYFDDLSWQYLKLDEGYFISGINAETTTSYDNLDNAVEFTDDGSGYLEAVIGVPGDASTYVSQIMISTTRGDDAAFKGATLKPQGMIHNNPEEWLDYVPSTNAKLDLPGLGVWKVWIDTEYNQMAFELLEGTPYEEAEPVEIVTNATEIVVHGLERKYTEAEGGEIVDLPADYATEADPWGQPWDNQFFIVANRTLKADEVTVVKFSYKASTDARTTTQCHAAPGAYLHWGAIGDVNFTEDWQEFEVEFKVPAEADGMQSIAFNMAEIKEACDYEITSVQWYLKDNGLDEGMTYENLIDAEGTKNFYVKEGAGTDPYIFGTDPNEQGISSAVNTNAISTVSYNLAGQRVVKGYKGIVVKSGKKNLVK